MQLTALMVASRILTIGYAAPISAYSTTPMRVMAQSGLMNLHSWNSLPYLSIDSLGTDACSCMHTTLVLDGVRESKQWIHVSLVLRPCPATDINGLVLVRLCPATDINRLMLVLF